MGPIIMVLERQLLLRGHPRVRNGSYPAKWTRASESSAASGDNRALKVLMGEGSPPNFVSVATQCLRLDPVARISAADALRLLEAPTLGEPVAASRLPEREPAGAAAADEAEPLVGNERHLEASRSRSSSPRGAATSEEGVGVDSEDTDFSEGRNIRRHIEFESAPTP